MNKILLIGAGGAAGALSRYVLAGYVYKFMGTLFPYGTLFVNVLGCLIIGFLGVFAEERMQVGPAFRLFVFIGFLGAFTTFSSFTYETWMLAKDGDMLRSLLNVFGTMVSCFGGFFVGVMAARLLS